MKIITLSHKNVTHKSKLGTRYYNRYTSTPWFDLDDCYVHASFAKREAFEAIRNTMHEVGGHDLRVLFAGCQTFTTGYLAESDGVEYLVVDTKSNRMFIPTC